MVLPHTYTYTQGASVHVSSDASVTGHNTRSLCLPAPTTLSIRSPSMLSTSSTKSSGNETRAATPATSAAGGGSALRSPSSAHVVAQSPSTHSVPSTPSSGVQQQQYYRNI